MVDLIGGAILAVLMFIGFLWIIYETDPFRGKKAVSIRKAKHRLQRMREVYFKGK